MGMPDYWERKRIGLLRPNHKPAFGTVKHDRNKSNGLIGHWLFNEGAGNTVYDLSGNGNHGALKNGPTWTATKFGGALDFDGVDDYVSTPNIINPFSTDFTAIAWVNIDSFTNLDVNGDSLILLQQEGVVGRTWLAFKRISYGVFRLNSFLGGSTTDTSKNLDSFVGQWHQVAVSVSGTTVTLFIDGVSEGSSTKTMESETSGMRIGSHKNPSTISEEFSGAIDDVRIYNRALSADEVWQLYTNKYQDLQPRRIWVPVGISVIPSGTIATKHYHHRHHNLAG